MIIDRHIVCFSKNCAVFSDDGFVGGAYSSTFTNTSGYPYARLLNDRGGVYSSLFWYDRQGRLLLNQNTKLHNLKTPAYNYTLYDAIGRVLETGQKTENTDAVTFNTIFGDTILGFYNPNIISPSKYMAWIKDNTGPRTEVTHNYFDVQDILPQSTLALQQIRNRVATTTYSDTLNADSLIYSSAIHYSYDIGLGKVVSFIQDNPKAELVSQRYKKISYQYDLISGTVNELDYQSDSLDQYHLKYGYDANNRISQVQSSKDSILWDNDANYFYYAHGPMARVEIGDQQVQGIDYAYTLQGYLKGVNSDLLDSNRDMGHDGLQVPGNLNKSFARDAMGYTLKYFDKSSLIPGDYDAINKTVWNNNVSRFEAYSYNSDLMNARRDLFNGNITAVVTDIQEPQEYASTGTTEIPLPQGTAYNYDQLNRLIDEKAFQNLDTDNVWGLGNAYMGLYHNWLTYDENGNILTQKRADQYNNIFDSLTYHYNIEGSRTLQNRLYHINDAITSTVDGITNDLKDEGVFDTAEGTMNQKNNYRYNAIGELAKDTSAGLDTIIWTGFHKVSKVKKYNGDSLIFAYDACNHRSMKEYKPAIGNPVYTYYVNDEKGNILAVYKREIKSSMVCYSLVAREIYGSQRIGVDNTTIQLIGAIPATQIDTFSRYLGVKQYEMNNYLNSVLVVVSDRKIPRPNPSNTLIDHYEADVVSAQDYYSFGMDEPGRTFKDSVYRFAYNGKEHDDEFKGSNNSYDFGDRMYDPRIGIWTSLDPKANSYPFNSPYIFAADNPIVYIDLKGDDWFYYNSKDQSSPSWHWSDGHTLQISVTNADGTGASCVTLTGERAVIDIAGSRNESTAGADLTSASSVTATITLYAPDGNTYTYTGQTMTSDPDKYTPIDEGIYEVDQTDEHHNKSGTIDFLFQVNEEGDIPDAGQTDAGALPTMNCANNANPDCQNTNKGTPVKTAIFLHNTVGNKLGETTSEGCLLVLKSDFFNGSDGTDGLKTELMGEEGQKVAILILSREGSDHNPDLYAPCEESNPQPNTNSTETGNNGSNDDNCGTPAAPTTSEPGPDDCQN
ncbi:MAG: RHS repeat-associated core domain-containing protein [Bacteroidia bacterium]